MEYQDDMQGLAHFCEHLLFMGTKEFPSEAEYSQYITSNGGSTNAYTDSSNTVYYFTVSHKHLSGALDRFSGFFHSSLFDPDCTMREVRAVDAEAKLYAQSDVWRLWQLFRSNAKPGHPAAKYNVGNVETLTEAAKKLATSRTTNGEGDKDGEDDLIAQETRRRVMTWWQEHYCASIMCLVILGRESLDELTQMAVKGLSPVPNRGLTRPVETHPWGPEQQGYLIFAKTVQENDSLSLQFPLGRQDLLYESKPARYLSHFIGHEGPGSLHSYLKCKGWVTELWSGSFSAGRGIEYMEIDMKLTKSGIGKAQ
jgi:insulysin